MSFNFIAAIYYCHSRIANALRTCLSIALGLSGLAYAPSVSALSEYIAAPINMVLADKVIAPPQAKMSVVYANLCFATHNDGTTMFSSADAQAVRDAIAAASSGGTVKVAGYCAGVSMISVAEINQELTLKGGYTSTNWTTYNPAANPTVLDAQGAGRVLNISNPFSATIQGLTITNGYHDTNGAAIYAGGEITLIDAYVYNNLSDNEAGGLFAEGNGTILNSTF